MNNFPTKIGVGCIVRKDQHLLLGLRRNSHGHGTWGFPGGHLEVGEHPFDCALRETQEETGLIVTSPRMAHWSFDAFDEKQCNYLTLFVETQFVGGEPELLEPDKCERWDWFLLTQLP